MCGTRTSSHRQQRLQSVNYLNPKSDESGTGGDESGISRDKTAAGWDESATGGGILAVPCAVPTSIPGDSLGLFAT